MCVDTPNIDSLSYIPNREMVIYFNDYATIVHEEAKECADKIILFSDEDPTMIDKGKVEECAEYHSLMKTQRQLESTKSKNALMRKYYYRTKTQRQTIRKKPKYG